MKAQGKCTTDHISAAGPWLKYRGHLENISGNLFLGVVNAFTGATGEGKDVTDGETRSYPEIAKRYGEQGIRWCAVGDRNYGEGSSREHAAMEPRFPSGVVIFARSFARIHETNAKKQGLVPLTFADPATYDEIGEDDRINVLDLPPVPGQQRCAARSSSPTARPSTSRRRHTFSDEQVAGTTSVGARPPFPAPRPGRLPASPRVAGWPPTPQVSASVVSRASRVAVRRSPSWSGWCRLEDFLQAFDQRAARMRTGSQLRDIEDVGQAAQARPPSPRAMGDWDDWRVVDLVQASAPSAP